eukprot:m.6573 g.6573  ORF g.6573 m.6573 type:complete len:1014 (+) comp2639_c0_seq1:279-3320(+)
MTASQGDETAFAIMTALFGGTILWILFSCWRSTHRAKTARRRRRTTVADINSRRRSSFTSNSQDRLTTLFLDIKDIMLRVPQVGFLLRERVSARPGGRGAGALPDEQHISLSGHLNSSYAIRAVTNAWVMILTLRQRFDEHVLNTARKTVDPRNTKQLSSWVATMEKIRNELDVLTSEDAEMMHQAGNDGDEENDGLALPASRIANSGPIERGFRSVTQEMGDLAKTMGIADRMEWFFGTPEMEEIERQLRSNLLFNGEKFLPENKSQRTDSFGRPLSLYRRFLIKFIPYRMRRFIVFYALLFLAMVVIFLSHAAYMGRDHIRSSFRATPVYYDLENVDHQRYMVPVIYGLGNVVLFCFTLLPHTMMKGLYSDLLHYFPRARTIVPLDDGVYLHILLSFTMLSCIAAMALLWIVSLGITCFDDNATGTLASDPTGLTSQQRACLAFNPDVVDVKSGGKILFDSFPGASYFDPRDNPLFYRQIVWVVMFFVMPTVLWTTRRPYQFLPAVVRRLWWEFLYHFHLVGALVIVIVGMYARFEVFWPSLVFGWFFWILEKLRCAIWHTYTSEVIIDADHASKSSVQITSPNGQPTVMMLRVVKPAKFPTDFSGHWLQIQFPHIDRIWHAYAIASSPQDEYLRLLVAVMGNFCDEPGPSGEWIQPPKLETWSYKLCQTFRELSMDSYLYQRPNKITVRMRGPFGSPFTRCFDSKYPAVVVIGGGTGLTVALSVLKELAHRRMQGELGNKLVWFVWSCKRIEDLILCWQALHELLFDVMSKGGMQLSEDWNPLTSVMLDWLSITIYVTDSDRHRLISFLDAKPLEACLMPPRKICEAAPPPPMMDTSAQRSGVRLPPIGQWMKKNNKVEPAGDEDQAASVEKRRRRLCNPPLHITTSEMVTPTLPLSGTVTGTVQEGEEAASSMASAASSDKFLVGCENIQTWMKERVLECSMDSKHAHIGNLFQWICDYVADPAHNVPGGANCRIAVNFCGPSALATVIGECIEDFGPNLEYSFVSNNH